MVDHLLLHEPPPAPTQATIITFAKVIIIHSYFHTLWFQCSLLNSMMFYMPKAFEYLWMANFTSETRNSEKRNEVDNEFVCNECMTYRISLLLLIWQSITDISSSLLRQCAPSSQSRVDVAIIIVIVRAFFICILIHSWFMMINCNSSFICYHRIRSHAILLIPIPIHNHMIMCVCVCGLCIYYGNGGGVVCVDLSVLCVGGSDGVCSSSM